MGNIDFKDKKNIYAISIILLILGAAYCVYTYMWDPFVQERTSLENQLHTAQAELDKINAQKKRVAELEMQLKHCIIAHHGELEFGSPKKPAMFEALALNLADNMDAKLQTMTEILNAGPDGDLWLGRNRFIDSNIRRTTV